MFSYRWPNGIVPYTIDAAFSDFEREIIASGFNHVQNNSCVRFDFHAYCIRIVGHLYLTRINDIAIAMSYSSPLTLHINV